MAAQVSNTSSMLFDFLKSRFELNQTTDENGKPTVDSSKVKVFGFDFITAKGENLGNIVISLLDDGESSDSVKVYFGKDVADTVGQAKSSFNKFLQDLRQFSKSHMLGFDVRDINRSGMTAKDQAFMYESRFGKLDGSSRTSKQPLEGLKIVIKHSDKVNPESRGSRSRRIAKIFLANDKGERFLLPFISLSAARAMAQHVYAGGTPYDDVAGRICSAVDEGSALKTFLKKLRKAGVSNPAIAQMLEIVAEKYNEIKGKIGKMSTSRGYAKHKDSLPSAELTESSYVARALKNHKQLKESTDFENWVDKLIAENSLNDRPSVPHDQPAQAQNQEQTQDPEESSAQETPDQEEFDVIFKNRKGGVYQKQISAKDKTTAKKLAIKFAKENNSKPIKITACENASDHSDEDKLVDDADDQTDNPDKPVMKESAMDSRLNKEIVHDLSVLWNGIAHDFYASYGNADVDITTEDGRQALSDLFTSYYPDKSNYWNSLSYDEHKLLLAQALPDGEVEGSNPNQPVIDHSYSNLDNIHSQFETNF